MDHGHDHHMNMNIIDYHPHQIQQACKNRIVTTLKLHGRIYNPIQLQDLHEVPPEHRTDRPDRQKGGEQEALQTLLTFLSCRGSRYATGISSPNTSWSTGSRLSPYLAWGNVSLRFVIWKTREKQQFLREEKKRSNEKKASITSYVRGNRKHNDCTNAMVTTTSSTTATSAVATTKTTSTTVTTTTMSNNNKDESWLKSLQAFSSRIHWRSHFIQKLESEPLLEKRDLCPAYQHLRRQENDWNQSYYDAWSTGHTGFPFVDACMRCLLQHGWLNFRMRAMLVSFATYNLWLDWKRIAPHLARTFLDYEPGIHYPQLQMQSGTTGINAMRVYNVTKQSKDQDPNGIFIRKYVPELKCVPSQYIHEPSKMPHFLKEKIGVFIGAKGTKCRSGMLQFTQTNQNDETKTKSPIYYPKPIVNEQESAKVAKDQVAAVRKQEATKHLAQQVYQKHGSRTNRGRKGEMTFASATSSNKSTIKSSPSTKRQKIEKDETTVCSNQQRTIKDLFAASKRHTSSTDVALVSEDKKERVAVFTKPLPSKTVLPYIFKQESKIDSMGHPNILKGWNCKACTFFNKKTFCFGMFYLWNNQTMMFFFKLLL